MALMDEACMNAKPWGTLRLNSSNKQPNSVPSGLPSTHPWKGPAADISRAGHDRSDALESISAMGPRCEIARLLSMRSA